MHDDEAIPSYTQVLCTNVISVHGGVVFVRESKPSALDRWSLPGGRLERGESLREGAAREVLEETGLEVEVESLVAIYHFVETLEGGSAVNFVFRSTVRGGEMQPSNEHPEVAALSRERIAELAGRNELRGVHIIDAIAAAEAGTSISLDLITEVGPAPAPKR